MTRSLSLINGHSSSTPVLALEQNRRVEDPLVEGDQERKILALIDCLRSLGYSLDDIRREFHERIGRAVAARDRTGVKWWTEATRIASIELARHDNAVLSELEGEFLGGNSHG